MLNPPNTDFWKRVNALFHSALDVDESARARFLEEEAEGDDRLKREVESLLGFHTETQATRDFLEKPVAPQLLQTIGSGNDILMAGESVGDFLILKVLGSGAFATVYLAQQMSLNRRVALKVSADIGEEGRTMAPLEHDHIVKVFSQEPLPEKHARLICMQYVAGTTLEKILQANVEEIGEKSGTQFLRTLDRLTMGDTTLNPAGLSDRETLGKLDFVDTVLWLGARLADALAYAHSRNVLHLDVKPGNILINPYGRPLLTDFNVSVTLDDRTPKILGGTLNYMAPEHRELFDSEARELGPSRVDHRADIYSLGIVLKEMLAKGGTEVFLERPTRGWEQVLAKCLAADSEDRFHSAAALKKALEGCLELRAIDRALPPAGLMTRFTLMHPMLALVFFMVGPNLLASVINISYNSIRIVSTLSPSQQVTFRSLVLFYNVIMYPLCVFIVYRKLRPLPECILFPERLSKCSERDLASRRRSTLNLVAWIIGVVALGWMPGSLFFPLGIHLLNGPVDGSVFLHFFISFGLSCLVAMTYSFLYTQFVALRVFYPRLWSGTPDIRTRAREELRAPTAKLRLFHLMAGVVPLAGAMLVVLVGPDSLDPKHYQTYRMLVSLLIASGMIGLILAVRSSNLLSQTLFAFTGSEDEKPRATF